MSIYKEHKLNLRPIKIRFCPLKTAIIGRALIIREITLNDIVDSRTSTDDITPRIRYSEFAPIGGCGVMFNMFKISVFGDVRYKYGFTNLSNVDNSLGFTNSALWISAGLLLNL